VSELTKIRAVLIPVGEEPRVVELDDATEGLQAAVGGYFELLARFPLGPGREADLWGDDAASLKDAPPNRMVLLPGFESVVLGPVVVTAAEAAGTPENDGETYSLTSDEIAFCLRVVGQWPMVE
jgi:hypothetical protein